MTRSLAAASVFLALSLAAWSQAQTLYPTHYSRDVRGWKPVQIRQVGYPRGLTAGQADWPRNPPIAVATPYASQYPSPFTGSSPFTTVYAAPYAAPYQPVSGFAPATTCEQFGRHAESGSLARYNYRHADGRLDKYVKKNLFGDPTIFHRDEPLRNALRFLFP